MTMMRCPKAIECPRPHIKCPHREEHNKRLDCEDSCTLDGIGRCVPVQPDNKPIDQPEIDSDNRQFERTFTGIKHPLPAPLPDNKPADSTESYWWCPECKEEKAWHHVTYQECCTDCGTKVIAKTVSPPAKLDREELACVICGSPCPNYRDCPIDPETISCKKALDAADRVIKWMEGKVKWN